MDVVMQRMALGASEVTALGVDVEAGVRRAGSVDRTVRRRA
jgi:hypothetical protein